MDFTQCIMQSVYVINCIEVLVMTSIVGECWRIICHYIVRDYIRVHQLTNIGFIHSDCCTKICESCLTCMLVVVRSECEFVRKFPVKYSRGQYILK